MYEILIGFCLVLLISLLGFLIVRVLFQVQDKLSLVALVFPVGLGSLTFTLFLLSWMGITLSRGIMLLTLLAPIVGLAIMSRMSYRGFFRIPSIKELWKGRLFEFIAGVLLVLGIILLGYLAVARSYSTWDAAAIWASKGYGIAHEQTIFAAEQWGSHKLSYPLNVPLAIAFFRGLSGDHLPISKLIFPFYYTSCLFAVLAFWKSRQIPGIQVLLGILMLFTVPELLRHATQGYANIPMASYFVIGSLLAIEGLREGNRRVTLLAAFLFGFAAWTRAEGIVIALGISFALFVSGLLINKTVKELLVLPLGLAIMAIPWLVFYSVHGASNAQSNEAMQGALASILNGDLNLYSLRLIFGYFRRSIFEFDLWGVIFMISIPLIGLNVLQLLRKKDETSILLISSILGSGLAVVFTFYVGSFDMPNLLLWLERGFPRAFFSVVIMMAVLAINTDLTSLGRRWVH